MGKLVGDQCHTELSHIRMSMTANIHNAVLKPSKLSFSRLTQFTDDTNSQEDENITRLTRVTHDFKLIKCLSFAMKSTCAKISDTRSMQINEIFHHLILH